MILNIGSIPSFGFDFDIHWLVVVYSQTGDLQPDRPFGKWLKRRGLCRGQGIA
jgi:hypothetical protein